MAPRPILKLDDYVPYLVNRVGAALVDRFTEEVLARHRLTIDMWRVLAALSDHGRRRQVDLAGMTSIEASTVSRLVTRLVNRGLAIRVRSRANNREVLVQLSAKGKRLVGKLIPLALDLERIATAGTSAHALSATKLSLRRIYANLASPRAG